MNHQEFSWRYSFLGTVFFVIPVLITLQIIRIQVDPEWVKNIIAESEHYPFIVRTITPPRGQIYDKHGNLLAGNHTVFEVGIELHSVRNPKTIAEVLSTILDVKYADVSTAASIEPSSEKVYTVIANYVSQEEIDKLDIMIDQINQASFTSRDKNPPSLSGVVYQPHLARSYPEKEIACNILGFVDLDRIPRFGLEEKYESLLAGVQETILVPLNPNRARELPEIPAGSSLILTIDRAIQRSMEELVDATVIETGSKAATIVVMNPKTGEILSLATTPRIDLNEFWRVSEVFTGDVPFNRAISQAYEPGSVFKVFTMAAALDVGTVTPDTVFLDTGTVEVGGLRIYNWNMGAWGPQTMLGCMQHSLNVCLASVAVQLGAQNFYKYLQAFGIGRLTGIDLAGEVPGRLKIPGDNDWYAADLGTNAFGQGVSATPIQMAMGISAVANHGVMMTPQIVRSVVNDEYQYDIEPRIKGMPISAETAETLSEMLATSLETESSIALVTGYRVSGKTGTAEIPTPFGYTTNETNASFVGWGPVDDPQFLIYVWLERPEISPWGSVVAAPVFRQAVEKLVVLLNLPPDDIRLKMKQEEK